MPLKVQKFCCAYLAKVEKKWMRWSATQPAAGGTTYNEPQDHGFMYAHGYQDLDGHIWEVLYMEPNAVH